MVMGAGVAIFSLYEVSTALSLREQKQLEASEEGAEGAKTPPKVRVWFRRRLTRRVAAGNLLEQKSMIFGCAMDALEHLSTCVVDGNTICSMVTMTAVRRQGVGGFRRKVAWRSAVKFELCTPRTHAFCLLDISGDIGSEIGQLVTLFPCRGSHVTQDLFLLASVLSLPLYFPFIQIFAMENPFVCSIFSRGM